MRMRHAYWDRNKNKKNFKISRKILAIVLVCLSEKFMKNFKHNKKKKYPSAAVACNAIAIVTTNVAESIKEVIRKFIYLLVCTYG